MRKLTKAVSVVLASTLIMASGVMLGGCNKVKNENPDAISEDQVWFNSKKFELEIPYDKKEFEFINTMSPTYLDDKIYLIVDGVRMVDKKEAEKEDFNYNDHTVKSICQYDLDGNFIKELPLKTDKIDIMSMDNMSSHDGKLKIVCNIYDKEIKNYEQTQILLDPETNEMEKMELPINIGAQNLVDEYLVGDASVYLLVDYQGDSPIYTFYVCKPGEKPVSVRANNAVNDIEFIDGCIVADEDTLLAHCFGPDNEVVELSVKDCKVTKSDKELPKLSTGLSLGQDGKSYSATTKGIDVVNNDLELETVIDFNDCNVNVSDFINSKPLHIDDDFMVISTSSVSMDDRKDFIYVLDRADENPNADKKILDVYSLSPYVSYANAEAIVKFNDTNSEYYAKLRFADNAMSYNDEELSYEKLQANISNQLMVDILSGDGPDLVINGFENSQFNNPNFFVDLNTFMNEDKEFDKSKYFDNVFENSKSDDGGLYQLPASFCTNGIIAKVSDVGEGHIGFTYEDYIPFVSDVCNGTSPLNYSRNEYINFIITSGGIEYIKDGKVDFNSEEFKKLAEFARDNFPEKLDYQTQYFVVSCKSLSAPKEMNLSEVGPLIWEAGGTEEPVGFYGLPALKEQGMSAYISSSAAISSEADEDTQKACWELIKTMLSDDVQENISDAFPMNKEAFKSSMQKEIDKYNVIYDYYNDNGYEEAIRIEGYKKVNEDVLNSFYDSISNITNVSRADSALYPIIAEELAAYFAGQKDIDSVITIINDRAQTVFDERKTSK